MKKYLYLIALLMCWSEGLFAQVTTLPFEETDLMFIQLQRPGETEPLHFIFDTGASTAVIDQTVAQQRGIIPSYSQTVTGAGGSKNYQIADGQTLLIGDQLLSGISMVLADLTDFTHKTGRQVDGIIGADIFQQWVVAFNFESGTMSLYDSIDDVDIPTDAKKLSYSGRRGSIPEVELSYTFRDGLTDKGTFLFDSGANLAVLFNTPYSKNYNLIHRCGKTLTSQARSMNTTSSFTLGSVDEVVFHGFSFTDVPVNLSQNKQGVTASVSHTGLLGAKIIHRFNFILDHRNRQLFLQPNYKLKDAFKVPSSGISLKKIDNRIEVGYTIPNTEAARLGMQEGDEILQINDYSGKDLEVIKETLQKKATTVTLRVKKRDGAVKTVQLPIKPLI